MPVLRAMITGTTGWPTSVNFSAYELRVIVALSALAMLFDSALGEEDVVQMNTSSRATLGNIGLAGACARIGALAYLTVVVEVGPSCASGLPPGSIDPLPIIKLTVAPLSEYE
jgi:phenylacetate-coenzyme A ligase PaaK-like adenylate-forming protein